MAGYWRRYGIIILALAAIAAVSAGLLSIRGRPLDIAIFRAINAGLAGPALDALGYLGDALGTFWLSLALFAALFFAGYRRFGLSSLGAIATGALLVVLIKYLAATPRPPMMLAGVRVVGFPELTPAFPSGHAEQAFLTAYLLVSYFLFRWYVQAALYGAAACVGLSRIYVGAHLPSDVAAGALIGVLWGMLWVHTRLWPGRHRAQPQAGGDQT
ncbi:MAG TPA: phosphatase PAP2 family protein [Anaerolineae bacterium]|nr:phosphatase PAP2 family protein [Anaerolineae bacterium]HOR01019.1 phosphatase PAP2 family protein [Anaerolineae bacterium]HPL29175.1 phosphatase PAP2 family protein [Anaerolineae bacterium]